MSIELSIIIPVFGRWDLTRACLQSLADQADCLPENFEVLVADNAAALPLGAESRAACPGLGQSLFTRFYYLPQPNNLNFAGACNLAAKAAKGRLLFFLNNDTVVHSGWYAPLAASLKNVQLAAPLLVYPPQDGFVAVQHAGTALDPACNPVHIYEHFPADHRVIRSRNFQAVTGAAWLLERNLFLQLGGFDQAFRNGCEDLDFCSRLKTAGGKARLCPASRITHLCGQSPGRAAASHENHTLLRSKPSALTPDLAQLLAADGYTLSLTPWNTWQAAPGPQLMAMLRPLLPSPGSDFARLAALAAVLRHEPFWLEGHLALMDALEAAGQLEVALRHGASYYSFAAGPCIMERVQRLARTLHAEEALAYANKILAAFYSVGKTNFL